MPSSTMCYKVNFRSDPKSSEFPSVFRGSFCHMLLSLPNELLAMITSHLTAREYTSLYCTCKHLYNQKLPFQVDDEASLFKAAPIHLLNNYEPEWTDQLIAIAFCRGLPVCTSLIESVSQDLFEIDSTLLPDWLSQELETEYEATLLHLTSIHGHLELTRQLLDSGFDINREDSDGRQPLSLCISANHTQIVNLLVEEGADRQIFACRWTTALHLAATCGTPGMLELLCDDIESEDDGSTPLFVAVEDGSLENVRWLVSNGANVMFKRFGQESVLDRSTKSQDPRVFGYLLQHILSKQADGYWKEDALTAACLNGNLKAVEKLLDLGTDVDGNPLSVQSPLCAAIEKNHMRICDYLLERGCSLRVSNRWSPLTVACQYGSVELIDKLLQRDPDLLDWSCRDGQFGPVHVAVRYKRPLFLGLLKEMGANLNTRDENGMTPRMVADAHALEEIDKILVTSDNYRHSA
ncbi:ankyrin repeat-containing domain protein [Gorgonomyces haynaldii]|nr:ankyrin repeat-containing domain protein [Gorgonomyces haynaldii]